MTKPCRILERTVLIGFQFAWLLATAHVSHAAANAVSSGTRRP